MSDTVDGTNTNLNRRRRIVRIDLIFILVASLTFPRRVNSFPLMVVPHLRSSPATSSSTNSGSNNHHRCTMNTNIRMNMAIPGYMVTDAKEVPEDKNDNGESASERDEPFSSGPSLPVLKALALHGMGSTGMEFTEILAPLQEMIKEQYQLDLQVTSPWAPWSKPKIFGSSWWTLPHGQRSYNAYEYIGFEASCNMILSELENEKPDVVIAHSQGAILIAALLALEKITNHPRLGYVLNGVAWPNPFAKELRKLKAKDDTVCTAPQLFFIMASQDEIHPHESAQQVKEAFETAGFRVSACTHPGSHAMPTDNEVVISELMEWVLDSH